MVRAVDACVCSRGVCLTRDSLRSPTFSARQYRGSEGSFLFSSRFGLRPALSRPPQTRIRSAVSLSVVYGNARNLASRFRGSRSPLVGVTLEHVVRISRGRPLIARLRPVEVVSGGLSLNIRNGW